MQLYEVTYPHSKGFDSGVPWTYLERVAEDPTVRAVATCVNTGERYELRSGVWSRLPKESR